jgi:hypothetical protein
VISGLPGAARLVRITTARVAGTEVHLQGVVEDRAVLAPGESARKRFALNRNSRQLRTELLGTEMSLTIA